MKKIRVVIAEDHCILRDGLRTLLESTGKFEVVSEAEDGFKAIEYLGSFAPDLLILDLSMPKYNGLSVLKEVHGKYPEMKIIVLTVHDSEEYLKEAFLAGAEGYCLKRNSFSELLSAIENVMDGKVYVTPSITRSVIQGFLRDKERMSTQTPWDSLTQREKEILKLIGEGYKNKQIAGLLYISPKTVEKHRSNLLGKLGVHNAAALAAYAIKMGLVDPHTPVGNDHAT